MIEKQQQRHEAHKARNAQVDKDRLSDIICTKFVAQPDYQIAETVMWYLHCRSEVRTLSGVETALNSSKKNVIPYCTIDDRGQRKLGLWLLEDLSELIAGTWGILEPPKARWAEKNKSVSPQQLDLIMVPGVAFDKKGGRLGNGAGYYDRLLAEVRSKAVLTAVCFESQLVEKVRMEKYDVYVDRILTEAYCYEC